MSDARSDIFARIREALKVKVPKPHLKGEPVAGKTSAAAKPWPFADTSNSSAAKATVCVNTVFTNAAGSVAKNNSTITCRRCASRLLGTVKPNIERTWRASRAAVTTARAY